MKMRLEIGKLDGSRPFSSSAARRIGTDSANCAIVDPPEPIQPSAIAAVRRMAFGWPTPIQIGGGGLFSRPRAPPSAGGWWEPPRVFDPRLPPHRPVTARSFPERPAPPSLPPPHPPL